MANIKFSGFTAVTDVAGIQEIVGYNGTANVRISPVNFINSSGGPYLPLTGGDMSGATTHGDGVHSYWGDSNDLDIHHDNLNSYITNNTNGLLINTDTFRVLNAAGTEQMLRADTDDAVQLYFNNSVKLKTTNTGINIDVNSIITSAGNANAGYWLYGTHAHGFVSNANGDLRILALTPGGQKEVLRSYIGSANKLVIDGDNYYNVGIGATPTTGYKLDVVRTSPGYSIVGRHSSGGKVGIYNSTGDNGIGTVNNYNLNLFTNNSAPQVTVATTGNVGIGTTSPGSKLDVDGSIQTSGSISLTNAGVNTIAASNASNGYLRFLVDQQALVLTLNANATATFASTVTATNFILSSDKRLKENIKTLEPKVISTKWRTFNVKDSDEGHRVGVIAQELEVKHPEFVETNEEGFKSVKYIDLLISKIAELEYRIKQLEK